MQSMSWKFVQSSPLLYANSLTVMTWKDRDERTVNELETNSDNTKKVCLPPNGSAFQRWINCPGRFSNSWNISSSPPAQTSISDSRSKHFSVQLRRYCGYTTSATTWFYLCEHGEDMKKWDRKPTSTLEAWEHELQGKTTVKGDSSRKMSTPVSNEQSSRQRWWPDLIFELYNRLFGLHPHDVSKEYNN